MLAFLLSWFSQALDQHVDGKKLIRHETEDSDFESYLRDATSRVIYQPTLMYDGSYLPIKPFDGHNYVNYFCGYSHDLT